jgi:hypothetical protein
MTVEVVNSVAVVEVTEHDVVGVAATPSILYNDDEDDEELKVSSMGLLLHYKCSNSDTRIHGRCRSCSSSAADKCRVTRTVTP